jgi:hypothetical protein
MHPNQSFGLRAAGFVAAFALFAAASTAEAAMAPPPVSDYSNPNVQLAWCAAGVQIGPLGACVGGPGPYYHHYYHRHCWRGYSGRLHCNY